MSLSFELSINHIASQRTEASGDSSGSTGKPKALITVAKKKEWDRMERTFCRWRRRRWWSGFWWRSTCCPVEVSTVPSPRVGGTPRFANASLPRLKGTNKEWVRICCDFLVRGRNKRKRIWFWFYRRRGKPLEKRWGSRSDRKPRRGCLASPPLFFRFYFRSLCVRLIYRS